MIYFVVLLLIVSLSSFLGKRAYCIAISFILILFAGLRGVSVGPDTAQYKYLFYDYTNFSFGQLVSFFNYGDTEIGYVLTSKFFSLFTNYETFQLFASIFVVVPASLLIFRYSRIPWVSYFIFFSLPIFSSMSMSMMRQGFAFGFFLIAYQLVVKRKFLKYALCIAIGFLFHASIICLIPIYFLYGIPYKRSYNKIIFVGLAIFFVFNTVIYKFVASFSRMQYDVGDSGGIKMLFFFLMLLLGTYLIEERILQESYNKMYFYLLVFTILCWFLGMNLAAVFRLAVYTEFFICLMVPNLFMTIIDKASRSLIFASILIVCFIVLKFLIMRDASVVGNNYYYPYFFFWE